MSFQCTNVLGWGRKACLCFREESVILSAQFGCSPAGCKQVLCPDLFCCRISAAVWQLHVVGVLFPSPCPPSLLSGELLTFSISLSLTPIVVFPFPTLLLPRANSSFPWKGCRRSPLECCSGSLLPQKETVLNWENL